MAPSRATSSSPVARSVARGARFGLTGPFNTGREIAVVDQRLAGPAGPSAGLGREVRQRDEDPVGSRQPLAHEGAGKRSDLVYAHRPGLPPLALDDPALAALAHLEVNVAVRRILSAGLAHAKNPGLEVDVRPTEAE